MEKLKMTVRAEISEKASQWLFDNLGQKGHDSWLESNCRRVYDRKDPHLAVDYFLPLDKRRHLTMFRMKFVDETPQLVTMTKSDIKRCNVAFVEDLENEIGRKIQRDDTLEYFFKTVPIYSYHFNDPGKYIKAMAILWDAFPQSLRVVKEVSWYFNLIIRPNLLTEKVASSIILDLEKALFRFLHDGQPLPLIYKVGRILTDYYVFDWINAMSTMLHVVQMVHPFEIGGGIDHYVAEFQNQTKIPPRSRALPVTNAAE
ncbi:hypothetical protein [Magnetospirillum sp. XM-1]|uniref:hypothetical protein n=1 Tax=Magnetospirillum sp. XM-1 TaxID=1663591 RepID=UPI0012E351C5|nr:hypothetical protein [Magnetospirillum sp. XM-1]